MKPLFTLVLGLFLLHHISLAQSVPQGMKYQAVARDLKGQVLADKDLQLKVTLYSEEERRTVHYSEIHKVTTNDLGLFSINIGEGLKTDGEFDEVPWAENEIWMEIAVQTDEHTEFVTISDSKMLSVPYAFHAATAGQLVQANGSRGGGGAGAGGTIVDPYWTTQGNANTLPVRDKLGTRDGADLVIVTNDTERMRIIAKDGNIHMNNSLAIDANLKVDNDVQLNMDGGNTYVHGELTVDDKSRLHSSLDVDGATHLYNKLTVDKQELVQDQTQSNTPADGALVVKGGVGIGGNLNVGGNTNITGDLSITGNTSLSGPVMFSGQTHITNTTQSTSTSTGALVVDGGVGIKKRLNVGEDVGIGGTLNVKTNNTGFAAKIENTEGTDGDGLEIKLGKTHPAWDGTAYLNVTNPIPDMFDNALATVEGWINGQAFHGEDLLNFWPNAYLAGFMCNMINIVTDKINEKLNLPASIPGFTLLPGFQLFPGLHIEGLFTIPPLNIPTVNFPTTPVIPQIGDVDCSGMPSFSMPNIRLTNVDNSLTNKNQFISFKDKDNRELGSVRAESVVDWRRRFFSADYFVDLMGEVVGIDIVSGIAGAVNKFTEIASSHNSMGVEYASGHGDYAEWLERLNANENITSGDIVGVRAGKISKDLADAEQVMAVSIKPIVLGNNPTTDREAYGNKIAFMGQIPVKVMGPVAAGDYIVGNQSTPGYGIAVHPSAMTTEYAKLTVGRSWDTNANDGPKMINTVVGVDNGNFLQIMQNSQKEISVMDARVKELESKMNAIVTGLQQFQVDVTEMNKRNAELLQQNQLDQQRILNQHKN